MRPLPAGYTLTQERDRIDAIATHAYLMRSYWAEGIPLETVERSIAHSLCVAVLHDSAQVAFARIVSDYATFAYLADVYVLEEHRGQGLSHAMLAYLRAHPQLQGLRRWALFTRDMQPLYRQYGFTQYTHPEWMMTRDNPDVYR